MKYNSVQSQFSSESSTYPVTLEEAKTWIKIDTTIIDDDDLITELIKSATRQCEGYTGISFIARTVTAILQNELGGVELPYGPVDTFTSLTDVNGDEIVSADYTLRGLGFKYLETPCYDYMIALYVAGYTSLPDNLKTGLLQQIAWIYENRGDNDKIGQMSPMAMSTLQPYRRVI